MDPIITYDVPHLTYWDWRIAADLFFGGAGVGAFLFGVASRWWYGRTYRRLTQTAAWIAPILVLIGLGLLMTELGHPERFWRTLITIQPASPLWWGGVFQTLFVVGAAAYALSWRSPEQRASTRRAIEIAVTPIALVVAAYHGLLLALLPARPLWNTGPTVVTAILAVGLTGIAVVLLAHVARAHLRGRSADTALVAEFFGGLRHVRHVLGATLVLQALTCLLWWITLRFGPAPTRNALELANESFGPLFWFGAIGIGLVTPLGLGALAATKKALTDRAELVTVVASSALILIGGFAMRLATILAGQLS
jgi:protein NrfD